MNGVMTLMLTGLVCALVAEGFAWRDRIYQFPFLASAMTFAFILPQMPGVSVDPFLPDGGYVKFCIMAILALLLVRVAWSARAQPIAWFNQSYAEHRLLLVAALLTAIGSYFYVKISHLPPDVLIGTQMSGAPVVYLFFARLLVYGLTIATLCFVRRPSLAAGIVIAIGLALCLERILVTGKRAEALELVLIGGLALWFHKRMLAPRIVVVAAIAAGTLAMSSMSDYRDINRRNEGFNWQSISQIDVTENFDQLLRSGGPEVRNAVRRIDYIDRSQVFDYGAFHWNRLVFNYVPAQLVGHRVKDALMLTMPPQGREYQPLTGTTETGMTDAFQSFWYFGAFKFLALAYIMSRLWASAMAGATSAQIVYILSIVPAMHAISHITDWVISVWVHMLIFLLPALMFACLRPKRLAPQTRLPLGGALGAKR